MLAAAEKALPADAAELLDDEWPSWVEAYSGDELVVRRSATRRSAPS